MFFRPAHLHVLVAEARRVRHPEAPKVARQVRVKVPPGGGGLAAQGALAVTPTVGRALREDLRAAMIPAPFMPSQPMEVVLKRG